MCFYRSLLFIGVGVIKGWDLGRNKSAVCLCELSLARERKKTIESSASSGPLSPCQTVSIGARRRAAGVHGRLRCAHEFYFCRLLECFVTFSTSSLRDLPLETTSHFTFIVLGRKAAVFLKGADTRHVLDSMTLPSCSCISSLCLTELLFISHASVHDEYGDDESLNVPTMCLLISLHSSHPLGSSSSRRSFATFAVTTRGKQQHVAQ